MKKAEGKSLTTPGGITYTAVYTARRSLCLELLPTGEALVRAPLGCPREQTDPFVDSHRRWLENHRKRQEGRPASREISREEEAALRRAAAELLPKRVAYYSALTGLTPRGIRITGAQKRFGSCSGDNRLCFSWRLMLYPPEAIDYVVVHELCHIRHHDHSPAFHALVGSILPDHEVRRKLLR